MRAALIHQHATETRARALADRLNALVEQHRSDAQFEVGQEASSHANRMRARSGHAKRKPQAGSESLTCGFGV